MDHCKNAHTHFGIAFEFISSYLISCRIVVGFFPVAAWTTHLSPSVAIYIHLTDIVDWRAGWPLKVNGSFGKTKQKEIILSNSWKVKS